MREVPPLQVLCLRAVGSTACSAEATFATSENGDPSSASRLLRSFHERPVSLKPTKKAPTLIDTDKAAALQIPMDRSPCIGQGSARRHQANEVDLHHPIIACRVSKDDARLIMEHGNPALECLQSYVDSLMELGRMDDRRLGVQFFEEWRANVLIPAGIPLTKKRKRTSNAPPTVSVRRASNTPLSPGTTLIAKPTNPAPLALGSFSLHNCTLASNTIEAMVSSGMGASLAVLDMSGIHGLTDEYTTSILPTCTNLERLSLKNCRRITSKSLECLVVHGSSKLTSLDIGGAYNITTTQVLNILPSLSALTELHASGLGWKDESVASLAELRRWEALSLGFSRDLTQAALRESLVQLSESLVCLALHFCEDVVDNALLGALGRNLPHMRFLDLRGNGSLSTLTGWYDGRASADLDAQPLTVVARYSSLTESSVEETRRVHPHEASQLKVLLDGSGMGIAIRRVAKV